MNIKHCLGTFLLAAGLVALGGCATAQSSGLLAVLPQQVSPTRIANLQAAAGEPVPSILVGTTGTARKIWAWQSLSNHQLLIYTRPNRAWLLSVGACPRLFDTPFIGVTASMGQIDGFSDVHVWRSPVPCRVRRIQPVDVNELQVAMSARPGASVLMSRAGGASASAPVGLR